MVPGSRVFVLWIYIVSSAICTLTAAQRTGTVKVTNNCGQRLLIQNHGCNIGDFSLEQGKSRTFSANYGAAPPPRVWANRCDARNNCETRGGNGQQSLAEFNWDPSTGKSFYDVSLVDGFNVPLRMSPFQSGNPADCTQIVCTNINPSNCRGNAVRGQGGKIVSCLNPNRDAPTAYSRDLNQRCPDVYAWSKDDTRRPSPQRFSCNTNTGYKIVFC